MQFESLVNLMKKDTYYLLYYVSSDIRYINEKDGGSKYQIKVIFKELNGSTLRYLTYYRSAYFQNNLSTCNTVVYWANEAELHILSPATIWQNGNKVAKTYLKESNYLTTDVINLKYYRQNFSNEINIGQTHLVLSNKLGKIAIPVMEIVRYFYLDDSKWNKLLFSGTFNSINDIVNVEKSSFNDEICSLRLRKDISNENMLKASLAFCLPEYLINLLLISKYVSLKKLNEIADESTDLLIKLPFSRYNPPNEIVIKYLGSNTTSKNMIIIHKLEKIEFKYPYKELIPSRDNPGSAFSKRNSETIAGESKNYGGKKSNHLNSNTDYIHTGTPKSIQAIDLVGDDFDFPFPEIINPIEINHVKIEHIYSDTNTCNKLLSFSTDNPANSGDMDLSPANIQVNYIDTNLILEFRNMLDRILLELKKEEHITVEHLTTLKRIPFKVEFLDNSNYQDMINREFCIIKITCENKIFYYFDISNEKKMYSAFIYHNPRSMNLGLSYFDQIEMLFELIKRGSSLAMLKHLFPLSYIRIKHSLVNNNETVVDRIMKAVNKLSEK